MKPVLTKHNQHLFNVPPSSLDNPAPPSQRLGKRAGDYALDGLYNEKSIWYETPEEIEAGLESGARKQEQLERVERVMAEILSVEERVTLELRFSHALSYRAIASIMDRNPSTIYRRVRRCIRKIRKRIEAES